MRIDKFLKETRIIKRRTVANEATLAGRVSVNGKIVKPSYNVKEGDIVTVKFGDKEVKFKVLNALNDKSKPDKIVEMIEK